jgi:hypothetical protein
MRRALLFSSLAAVGFGSASVQAAPPAAQRRTDRRLVGTWRSDRERTAKLWKYNKEVDAEAREKFESIFGKLTWRITPSKWFGEFEGDKFSGPYNVVASDSRSVVVFHPGDPGLPGELKQYFFEPEHMYVLSGYNVEFFKRVEA